MVKVGQKCIVVSHKAGMYNVNDFGKQISTIVILNKQRG